jgi:putative hydroxymethylpyrimidine transport system substrate-binding protein
MARPRPHLLAVLLIAALAIAGCSHDSEDRPNQSATLVLDFQPNAVHAGIYLALERDYDDAEGVTLHV